MIPLLIACTAEDPGRRPGASEHDPAVVLGPVWVWSEVEPAVDQHHATVTALPRSAPPAPGTPAAAVAWTDGHEWEPHVSRLLALDRDGEPLDAWVVDGGTPAEKPDVDVDREGRVLVAYDAADGIALERVALDGGAAPERATLGGDDAAEGNNSVDLAVRPDGAIVAVWYEQDDPVGRYRTAAVDGALDPVPAPLPAVLAEVDDTGPATPDVDVAPDGGVAVAWIEQHTDAARDRLLLDAFDAAGAHRFTLELDRAEGLAAPRRPTVAADPSGRLAVAWRRRLEGVVPPEVRLGFVEADGAWRAPPFDPAGGTADGLVIASAGPDAVWAVWTADPDPVHGLGTITGALVEVPSGAFLVGPIALSESAAASRPHTDTAAWGEDSFGVVVSWEEADPRGVKVLHGRAGIVEDRIDRTGRSQ